MLSSVQRSVIPISILIYNVVKTGKLMIRLVATGMKSLMALQQTPNQLLTWHGLAWLPFCTSSHSEIGESARLYALKQTADSENTLRLECIDTQIKLLLDHYLLPFEDNGISVNQCQIHA